MFAQEKQFLPLFVLFCSDCQTQDSEKKLRRSRKKQGRSREEATVENGRTKYYILKSDTQDLISIISYNKNVGSH
jgi:hypothetical protein